EGGGGREIPIDDRETPVETWADKVRGAPRRSERLRLAGKTTPPPVRKVKPKKVKKTVVKYLVKWKGWDDSYAEWKSVEDLNNAQDVIDEYEYRQLGDKGEDSVALHYI